jgi:fructokinase
MDFKNKKVLCLGEVLWDMLPSGPKAGGAPMNVAIHLKKFGVDVAMVSRVGNDAQGDKLKTFMEQAGLSTQFIQVDDKLDTSEVLVHFDENNSPSYEICMPVAWDNIQLTDSLMDLASDSGIVVLGTLALRSKATRDAILPLLDKNGLVLADINLRKPFDTREIVEMVLHRADIVKLNDDEIQVIAAWYNRNDKDERSLMRWIAEHFNCQIVIVTRGENGAIALREGKFVEQHGFKVSVADTVGSGDAFLAGFTASLLQGKSTEEALKIACATGALVATFIGGTPDYSLKDIERIQLS